MYKRCAEAMRNKGVTAYQVFVETGVSEATLSRLKTGKASKMSNKTASKLANFLGVSKDWLMYGDNETTKPIPAQSCRPNNYYCTDAWKNIAISQQEVIRDLSTILKKLQTELDSEKHRAVSF